MHIGSSDNSGLKNKSVASDRLWVSANFSKTKTVKHFVYEMESLPPFLLEHIKKIAFDEDLGLDYVIEHEAGSKHGDGFMAAMIAVNLKSKSNGKELPMICKLMPENKALQDLFSSQRVFDQEVMFYNEILPKFEMLQRQHGLTVENGFYGYPKCYFASSKKGESVIIMQDLRTDGFALWNKLIPIDVSRVRLFVEQLGRMHGLSFVLRDQHKDEFKQIQAVEDVMLPVCGVDPLLGMFMNSYDQAIEILDKEEHKDVMRHVKSNWRSLMEESMNGKLAEPFAVLAHGDCWNNNMMYQDNQVRFENIILTIITAFLRCHRKSVCWIGNAVAMYRLSSISATS